MNETLDFGPRKAVWDLDGTVLMNILEPNYEYYLREIGFEGVLKLNRINPIIDRRDVTVILTARHAYKKERTVQEVRLHGIRAEVFLNTGSNEMLPHSLGFKASWLNTHRPLFYVDDDPVLSRMLQPLLESTRVVCTDEIYGEKVYG